MGTPKGTPKGTPLLIAMFYISTICDWFVLDKGTPIGTLMGTKSNNVSNNVFIYTIRECK